MSVDTQIQGSPGSVEGAADWLRDQLATALGQAADRANDARRDASGSLRRCQDMMSDVRSTARGKGLTVTGFVVQDPGVGPSRPADDAGVGASALTGAAMGATFGSVVPGVGTAVGAVVGTAIGAGVAIFADGAIDSLFENGPDVGAAAEAGVEALADTGEAIADGVSSVAGTVGGWFS